jgi:hypothetical protein
LLLKGNYFKAQKIVNNYQLTQNYNSDKVFRRRLGWDSVLRLAAVAFILLLVLQIVFFFIFQNIGYDSKLLGIALTAFVLMFIVHIILRRINAKKFSY